MKLTGEQKRTLINQFYDLLDMEPPYQNDKEKEVFSWPKDGDTYFRLDHEGDIYEDVINSEKERLYVELSQECAETEEELEEIKRLRFLLKKFNDRRKGLNGDWEPDYDYDDTGLKYFFLGYDRDNDCLKVDYWQHTQVNKYPLKDNSICKMIKEEFDNHDLAKAMGLI